MRTNGRRYSSLPVEEDVDVFRDTECRVCIYIYAACSANKLIDRGNVDQWYRSIG